MRKYTYLSVAIAAVFSACGPDAASEKAGAAPSLVREGSSGFVYAMTNDPAGNSVVQYSRSAAGALTKVSEVATGGLGGTGNGVGSLDPLGSQHSLELAGSTLVAVNAGSNQVSALTVTSSGLQLLNTVASGGSFPNSVAVRNGLVYVLNAQGTPNITGFQLSPAGLTPLAGSSRSLPGGSAAAPHDVRFSPDGANLIVAEGGTNDFAVFDVTGAGVVTQPSAGTGPFGLAFARAGVLLNTEASSGSVSSYGLAADGTLSVISPAVSDGQAATCWITVTADGKFAFVSNTGSGNLSTYHASQNGTLDLEQAVSATADGGAPIDSAVSSDGAFLYVIDSARGRILIYRTHGADLTLIGTQRGLPTTVQGIAAQ